MDITEKEMSDEEKERKQISMLMDQKVANINRKQEEKERREIQRKKLIGKE